MFANGGQRRFGRVNVGFFQGRRREGRQNVRQPDNVVQMGMRQKDVDFRRANSARHAKKRRPRIEHNADVRQHDAGRMPPLVRVVAPRPQKFDAHRLSPHASGIESDPCASFRRGTTPS